MSSRGKRTGSKTRRFLRWPLVVGALLIAIILFFWLAPNFTERSMNRIEGSGLWRVSEEAAALHETLMEQDQYRNQFFTAFDDFLEQQQI